MSAKAAGAFALGFAIGALVVSGALWSTGTLKTAYGPPWRHIEAPQPASSPAVPDLSATASLPSPPVPPPEPTPSAPPQGFAERAAPEPGTPRPIPELHLAMPLAGIDPKSLTDSFN